MSSDAYLEDMANQVIAIIKRTRELTRDLKPTKADLEMMKRVERDMADMVRLRKLVEQKMKAEGL
jgi:hypothetical protein